ncbi:hypothetical protein, partial [Streptococcus pneumoniae]
KKHPLGEKRNHPGSKLRQGFWMVFRFGVNNWGYIKKGGTFLNPSLSVNKIFTQIKDGKTYYTAW